jgi:hypothetical protein
MSQSNEENENNDNESFFEVNKVLSEKKLQRKNVFEKKVILAYQ